MGLATVLNGAPVTRLRGLQFLSFNDVAIIQTPVIGADGGGGGTLTWFNAGTAQCRIYPVTTRGKTGLVGGQINEHSTHFCELPPLTAVDTTDRILISGRGTFEVTQSLETTSAQTMRVEVIQTS